MIANKLIYIGRLTKEVDFKVAGNNGTPVATINLAVDRNYKDSNGNKITDFFQLKAFRKTAEFLANYTSKGTLLAIEGHIRNDNYEKDGKTIYRDTYVVDDVKILAQPAGSGTQQPSNQNQQSQSQSQSNYGNQNYGGQDMNAGQQYGGNQQPDYQMQSNQQPQYNGNNSFGGQQNFGGNQQQYSQGNNNNQNYGMNPQDDLPF